MNNTTRVTIITYKLKTCMLQTKVCSLQDFLPTTDLVSFLIIIYRRTKFALQIEDQLLE